MYTPEIAFLRRILNWPVEKATAVPLKKSSTPAMVYRLLVKGTGGRRMRLILKRMAPDWPDDPWGQEREATFYAQALPKLHLPQAPVWYAGPEAGTGYQVVVMGDVSPIYRFPPPPHRWTMAEIGPILRTYARFHVQGAQVLAEMSERSWLFPRHEERVKETAVRLPQMVADITVQGIWPKLPSFADLLDSFLAMTPAQMRTRVTLLHNDVYPPNVALPRSPECGPVLLFDWEMAGWGLAEMDLAFLFLQPFGSDGALEKEAVLKRYWAERERLTGERPSAAERQARQWYADTLWVLWLIPTAHRVALHPLPPGAFPRRYWEGMLPVLANRLQKLVHDATRYR